MSSTLDEGYDRISRDEIGPSAIGRGDDLGRAPREGDYDHLGARPAPDAWRASWGPPQRITTPRVVCGAMRF